MGHWKWYEYKSNGIMTLHNDLFRIRYIIEPLINQLCGDLELKHILGCLLSDSNQDRFWVGQVTTHKWRKRPRVSYKEWGLQLQIFIVINSDSSFLKSRKSKINPIISFAMVFQAIFSLLWVPEKFLQIIIVGLDHFLSYEIGNTKHPTSRIVMLIWLEII